MEKEILNLGAVLPKKEKVIILDGKEYPVKISVLVWLKYLDKFKPNMKEDEVKAILPTLDIKDIVETSVPGLDVDKLSVQQLIKVFIFIMNETAEEFKSGLPQDLIEQDIKKNITEQQL
jgi:type III secretory pathway lipoprotein EscJ